MTSRTKLQLVPKVAPVLEPVRFSRLKMIDESAEHYLHGEVVESSPIRKGTALHSYLLGGKAVAVYEGRRDNRQEAWRDFQAEHAGKTILSPRELGDVKGMREAIQRHKRASELLDDGVQEQRITWTHKGRACAGTPDVVLPKNGRKRVVELKACHNVKPSKFLWHLRDMHYPAQLDWYGNGLENCAAYEPGPVDESFIVAVGMKKPYPVVVYRVRESELRKGRNEWSGWFDELLACEKAGKFPGYVDDDVVIDVEDDGPDGLGLDWAAGK